jgi:hypothetical protein
VPATAKLALEPGDEGKCLGGENFGGSALHGALQLRVLSGGHRHQSS